METPIPIPDAEFWRSADPLGEILHLMRMGGAFYSISEMSAPWGGLMPPLPDTMMFHFLTEGEAWVEVEGFEPRRLRPGTLALVPHGLGHRLVGERGGDAIDLFDMPREVMTERYEFIRYGGGGALTRFVCGAVFFEDPAARQLVQQLPALICVDDWDPSQMEWLRATLRLMATEAQELKPGGETILTRLADVLVIQALRKWLGEAGDTVGPGWLLAIRDPQIGGALTRVHRDPSKPWTIESLAREVGMSRSAFAARFRELAGESPMGYVTRWRMNLAATQLRERRVPLAELADQLGYQSEAAFSRAFKREMGVAPSAVAAHRAVAQS